MLRRTVIASVIALVLATGLVTAVPTPATAAPSYDNSIGIVTVPDQTWDRGCKRYRLRWRFNPPSDGWSVIVRIRSPRNVSLRSEFWDSGYTSKRGDLTGRLKFKLCGTSSKPGRYRIQMQMVYDVGRDTVTKIRKPVYFRLTRR